MAMTDAIKQVVKAAVDNSAPMQIMFGVVTQEQPLTILVENRLTISGEMIVVPKEYKKGYYDTHKHRLACCDRWRRAKNRRGQAAGRQRIHNYGKPYPRPKRRVLDQQRGQQRKRTGILLRTKGWRAGDPFAGRRRPAFPCSGEVLTLPTAKAGGFSAQPPQPAHARSYTVSPSVGFGRVPPYHMCRLRQQAQTFV